MRTLKGQNLRLYRYDPTAEKYHVIGMSTTCTITLTNNTDNGTNKDVVGSATMPVTTSKSWAVSCDSLDVADTAAILAAIKSMEPMTLMWDETSTTDNQTREGDHIARKGLAYLNDVTFNFNDRENSTKTLQFTGTSALTTVGSSEASEVIETGAYTKGQFVRLFVSNDNVTAPSSVIAAAKSLSLHVSLTLEDATTKDTEGEWQVQEPTGISYDITSGALVRGADVITSSVASNILMNLEMIYESGTPVKWQIANVGGANNRTIISSIVSGSAVLTQLAINAQNRQNADYTATFNGYGDYTVAA